jgi:hypothetical protein
MNQVRVMDVAAVWVLVPIPYFHHEWTTAPWDLGPFPFIQTTSI